MIHIYGIPTCGSVRKARTWFKTRGEDFVFHNFREEGLSEEDLDRWLLQADAERLLNKRGQLWRTVTEDVRESVKANPSEIRALLLEMPGLVKRPVIVFEDGSVTVGVDETLWSRILARKTIE